LGQRAEFAPGQLAVVVLVPLAQKDRREEQRGTESARTAGTAWPTESRGTAVFGLHCLPLLGRELKVDGPDVCDPEKLGGCRWNRFLVRFGHERKLTSQDNECRQSAPLPRDRAKWCGEPQAG